MPNNDIVLRTKLGDAEIVQPPSRRKLDKDLNTALFLVDGKRTKDEICRAIATMRLPPDAFDTLQQLGFIAIGKEESRGPTKRSHRLDKTARSEQYNAAKQQLYKALLKGVATLGDKSLIKKLNIRAGAPSRDFIDAAVALRIALNLKRGVEIGDRFFEEANPFVGICATELDD